MPLDLFFFFLLEKKRRLQYKCRNQEQHDEHKIAPQNGNGFVAFAEPVFDSYSVRARIGTQYTLSYMHLRARALCEWVHAILLFFFCSFERCVFFSFVCGCRTKNQFFNAELIAMARKQQGLRGWLRPHYLLAKWRITSGPTVVERTKSAKGEGREGRRRRMQLE